jgi:hypothetical protein
MMRALAWRSAQYPFTVATCVLIVFAGFLSYTAAGQTISRSALRQFGSSPRDLLALNIGRVITSAFVTDGGLVFWMALALTALFVGAAEHFTDTATAALVFWGAHFASFSVTGLVTLALGVAGSRLGMLLFVTRDVGPSAGYVGCLGLALVCSGWRYRWWVIALVAGALGVSLAFSIQELVTNPRGVSANIAHFVALAFGVASGVAVRRRRRLR